MTKLANYYTNPRRGSGKGNPRSRYAVTMSVILAWAGVRKCQLVEVEPVAGQNYAVRKKARKEVIVRFTARLLTLTTSLQVSKGAGDGAGQGSRGQGAYLSPTNHST